MVAPGLTEDNSQYTVLSTAGTTTLNPGQASGLPTSQGVLYGASVISAGTGFGLTLLDIVPQIGNNAPSTNTLLNGTGSAGQQLPAAIQGLGVRYLGALVAVTTGTPGQINVFWD